MSGRDSEKTKARIIRAARRLFAERDIASVGIRDIASAAGVSHGLVQRYCGTREQMVTEIVRQEVERFSVSAPPVPKRASPDELEDLRQRLKAGMHRFEEYARIIAREASAARPGAGECLRQQAGRDRGHLGQVDRPGYREREQCSRARTSTPSRRSTTAQTRQPGRQTHPNSLIKCKRLHTKSNHRYADFQSGPELTRQPRGRHNALRPGFTAT